MQFSKSNLIGLAALSMATCSSAFDATAKDNMVLYWGQASAGSQERLSYYCNSDASDIMVLSFMSSFPGSNGVPTLNFASACSDTFSSGLLKCDTVAQDIKTCQSLGKKVLLSLGGAAGSYGFSSDSEAEDFAATLWNLFGEGSADERPFGDAIIDGFDFDIENNNAAGYAALATKLRSDYFSQGSKTYYLSAAPQCFYPDASVGNLLSNAYIDFAFVQFYNNYCSINGQFNWDTWTNFAETISPNKDIKLFLGLPGSTSAAGSGYVDIDTVSSTVSSIGSDSQFGGVMLWDASQGFTNKVSSGETYAESIKDILVELVGSGVAATPSVTSSATSVPATTTLASSTAPSTATSSTTTFSAATSSISSTTPSTTTTLTSSTTPSITITLTSSTTPSTTTTSTSSMVVAFTALTSSAPQVVTSAVASIPVGKVVTIDNPSDYILTASGSETTLASVQTTSTMATKASTTINEASADATTESTTSTGAEISSTKTAGISVEATTTIVVGTTTEIHSTIIVETSTAVCTTSTNTPAAEITSSKATESTVQIASTELTPDTPITSSPTQTTAIQPVGNTTEQTVSTAATTTSSQTQATSTSASSAASDCSSLSSDAKAECLNNNFEGGLFTGSTSGCTNGALACSSDGRFAMCNWGTWVVQGCASGTTCYASAYGDYIYIGCNWPRS
jgi:chitinase